MNPIDVQEYEKRVIAHFKSGVTEAEWELIAYCICERNDKHKVMTGKSYTGERLSKFPEINSTNIQATEHPIVCLDKQLLNKEEIADLYMDEDEREARINLEEAQKEVEQYDRK